MNKNIHICHRPYQILRSCDLIHRNKKNDDYNILISYDVKLMNENKYQRFETNEIFYDMFDEVIFLQRSIVPSTRDFINYINYFKTLQEYYKPYIDKLKDVENLYFYSDLEQDIVYFVDMFKKAVKQSSNIILVDEGLATYERVKTVTWKGILYMYLFSRVVGFRNYNYRRIYGFSGLYNKSLANVPERANFRKPVDKLQPISEDLCRELMKKANFDVVGDKVFVFISSYTIPYETEIPVLKEIISVLEKYGYTCLLKLHPLQNEFLYKSKFGNVRFLPKGYPVEMFFNKNMKIGGSGSSALFNALLQGCAAVDLTHLFGDDAIGIVRDFPWIKLPVVDSFEEFETYLKKNKQ